MILPALYIATSKQPKCFMQDEIAFSISASDLASHLTGSASPPHLWISFATSYIVPKVKKQIMNKVY